jgi:HEAT repeat protein
LIGGRGLPKDLSTISVAGGHVIARPMDGAVEGMLAVLEDPRVEDASSALAGLVAKYRSEGPKALRPYQDRFRKLLTDPDQGIRKVAAWSLARTGDLAMAVPLIEALKDPDESVVLEARNGLQLLSRKIEGFGPAPGSTPEQKQQAIAKWQAWYESVRPITTAPDDPAAARPGASSRRSP